MSLKSFIRDIQELKGGIGSISRRSFDARHSSSQNQQHSRSRSNGVVAAEPQEKSQEWGPQQQSCWVDMPPELLRDIIQRLESSETSWPLRKHVVACAAVCTTWREITKELVKSPELSGIITFPISLKQPGSRDATMQCYIKRDRTTATYRLFLGLSPTMMENGKFLLAARKFRRATSTDYIISIDPDDIARGSSSCIGKLRSNFLGTKFAIYDTRPGTVSSSVNRAGAKRLSTKQTSSKPSGCSYNVAHISYELNVLGTRGPRRMQCTLHTVGAPSSSSRSLATESESTSTELSGQMDDSFTVVPASKRPTTGAVSDMAPTTLVGDEGPISSDDCVKGDPLVLKNKNPRWHEQLQCWCLNFRGRVTVASVKNFQLVAAAPGEHPAPQGEHDKVLLQFGKIGKDMFTMDYRYPLSAFQAFAICLSSFDTKLACE